MIKFYKQVHSYDVRYTAHLYTTVQKYTLLRVASKAVKILSDGPALPLFLAFYYFGGNPAPFFFAAYSLFWVFYHELGIKKIFQRHRPQTAGEQPGFSFPSSHAFTSGFAITSAFFFVFPWETVLVTFGILNAINRPAVGVHYIADVIAGLLLGAIASLGWVFTLGIAAVPLP